MNWDDLRILSAVRDAGTYAGASAHLRIDETTVARRLERVQRDLGVRLFEAVEGTRRPTAQGEAVLAHIQAMAVHAAEIGKVSAGTQYPVGRFRIAVTNSLAEEVLAPRIGRLLGDNPGLTLQFLTSGENVNFSRWEADFAIRLRKPDKGAFAISKLADIRLYLVEPADAPGPGPLVCAYPPGLDLTPESQFLERHSLEKYRLEKHGLQKRGLDKQSLQGAARCITDNLRVLREVILSRRAVGVLPEYLCGDLFADRRLRLTPLPKSRDAWLLIQNHLRRDPAARLVLDWIRACFREFQGR